MPRGIYKRTLEMKTGKYSGRKGGNSGSFKKGNIKSKNGHIHSKETKIKIKNSLIGKKHSIESYKAQGEKISGEKSHFWQGGISSEKYSTNWTNTLRISIRERDKYTCQVCGDKQGDRAYSVHHIDYNKLNNNPNNLITLCISCHGRTNKNRGYWIKYFNNYDVDIFNKINN